MRICIACLLSWWVSVALIGCGAENPEVAESEEGWAVTSWGHFYEVFAEADPLIAGQTALSHTHVTVLNRFLALTEGRVAAVLQSADGAEAVFWQDGALRPGIYSIAISPAVEGEFNLIFRVESPHATEDIPSGRVHVGNATEPGGLVEAPSYGPGSSQGGTPPIGFLKEQQWKTAFATEWTGIDSIHKTVNGSARIRAAVGGDMIVSAPVNGIASTDLRIHTGSEVRFGQELFRLQPRAAAEQSISELQSDLTLARAHLERVEKLHQAGMVPQAEVDAARSAVDGLKPLVEPPSPSDGMTITSPLTGRVAEVWVRPGQSVQAGESLLRIVKTSPLWVEVALDPAEADALHSGLKGLHVRIPGSDREVSFEAGEVRLVSMSPALDPVTGTVAALLELKNPGDRMRLGAVVEAEVATAQTRSGVVVPASALVDDGGTSVVYIQTEGESFERHEVIRRAGYGERVLLEGLAPGVRLVTVGGATIRRASLLSTGSVEGHVH